MSDGVMWNQVIFYFIYFGVPLVSLILLLIFKRKSIIMAIPITLITDYIVFYQLIINHETQKYIFITLAPQIVVIIAVVFLIKKFSKKR